MVFISLNSQKGFSLIRFTILLVILAAAALAVLSFLPRIGGGTFDVINQIGYKAKSVVNGLINRVKGIGAKLTPIKEKLARIIEDLEDRWYRYKAGEEGFTSRALEWEAGKGWVNPALSSCRVSGGGVIDSSCLRRRQRFRSGS